MVLVYVDASQPEPTVKPILFLALEITIPATAVICAGSLILSGRKALGWFGAMALIASWAAGLTLLAAASIAGREINTWMWLTALGTPTLGAVWLGFVTRTAIGERVL